jgi:hypothetical protein
MIIDEQVGVADLDEAIGHFYAKLKDDRYGNRINWKQKQDYWEAIDDLLDARIALTVESQDELHNGQPKLNSPLP